MRTNPDGSTPRRRAVAPLAPWMGAARNRRPSTPLPALNRTCGEFGPTGRATRYEPCLRHAPAKIAIVGLPPGSCAARSRISPTIKFQQTVPALGHGSAREKALPAPYACARIAVDTEHPSLEAPPSRRIVLAPAEANVDGGTKCTGPASPEIRSFDCPASVRPVANGSAPARARPARGRR
jgi:hypothetical protein